MTSTTSAASFASSSARVELGSRRGRRGLERPARLVGGLADRAALLGRQLGDAAQQVRQLGLAAEEARPARPRARRWSRRVGDRRLRRRRAARDPLGHAGGHPSCTRTGRPSPPSRRSATPSAIGMWRDLVARGEHVRRAALRARRRPRASRRARRSSASGRPSRATSATRAAGQLGRRRARAPPAREQRAHRGAHGLGPYGSALPGPSATLPAPNASARAQHGADVARVADAPQRHAQRPDRRGRPALRVDADRPRARAELGDRRRAACGATSSPSRPGARGARAAPTAPSRPRRRRRAGPPPRRRTRPACRATCGPRACGSP